MSSLDEFNTVHNNQLAFSLLEKELGIPPVMSASDLANSAQIDKLSMVLYLTQIQKAFGAPAKAKSLGMSKKHLSFNVFMKCSSLFILLHGWMHF